MPYPLYHLPGAVSLPVLLLGVAGIVLLLADRPARTSISYTMTKIVLLLWVALMLDASRTSLSGLPERFELDLGVPLALLLVAGQTAFNLVQAGGPSPEDPLATSRAAMNPEIQEAGEWLESHNTGGNIAVSPYVESVPSRALLVLGDYSGVQSFRAERIERNRDLSPSGQGPPQDMLWLLGHSRGSVPSG